MTTTSKPGGGSRLFGEALTEWLERARKGQKEVADRLQVQVSAISHWLAGRKQPSPKHRLRLLVHLHSWLGSDWTVAEALDGIALLGWTWEDVQQALTDQLEETEARTFREWWQAGKPQPLPLPHLPLPAEYVEREEQDRLWEMLTDWAAWRQARWRGIVVTGVTGAGKTTLLAALTQDEQVRRVFRDGILWLNGAEKGLLAQAAYRVGLDGHPGVRREDWARWAGEPHRRLLIVVDDGLPDGDLDALIAGIGPQVVLVVTTQKGPEVMATMERWHPWERLAEIILRGMREEEGLGLIERVLGGRVQERERETVRRVGNLLGWHPEGLRLAAAMAQDTRGQRRGAAGRGRWVEVLAFLEEEGLKGGRWDPLRWLVERQWERMGEDRRKWMEQTVWRTVRGGPLEEPLAGAIWGVRPEVARWILQDLERTGLVERVAVHPAEWWRGTTEMWRVTPVVFQVRREMAGVGRRRWRGIQRAVWRAWQFVAGKWQRKEMFPPTPFSLILVSVIPNMFATWVWVAPARSIERREKARGETGSLARWIQDKALGIPVTRLRKRWEQLGIQPSEELEMFDKQIEWTISILAVIGAVVMWGAGVKPDWMIAAGARWGLPGGWTQWATDSAFWLVLGLELLAGAFFVKPLWLCLLYGVRTRDLALMVQGALALSRPLQWLGPVRRERERLWEAWERSGGSG